MCARVCCSGLGTGAMAFVCVRRASASQGKVHVGQLCCSTVRHGGSRRGSPVIGARPPKGCYRRRFLVQNEGKVKEKLTEAWISSGELRGCSPCPESDGKVAQRGLEVRYGGAAWTGVRGGGRCRGRSRGRRSRGGSWRQGGAPAVLARAWEVAGRRGRGGEMLCSEQR